MVHGRTAARSAAHRQAGSSTEARSRSGTVMYVKTITIRNFRSFAECTLNLSRGLNVLIGANNSGKSTIIRALGLLQQPTALAPDDTRVGGATAPEIDIVLCGEDLQTRMAGHVERGSVPQPMMPIEWRSAFWLVRTDGNPRNVAPFDAAEPSNFVYPLSARRKVAELSPAVDRHSGRQLPGNLSNLPARADALCQSRHELHDGFARGCRAVLGFEPSTFAVPAGKTVGLLLRGDDGIPIQAMGEGTGHVVGFISMLVRAEGNLFLIEEIENDLHPKAMKELLKLVIECSERGNQFVVSTHSNIVARYLGGEPGSKLFSFLMKIGDDRIPTATVEEVLDDPEARRAVLEELKYEFADIGLWTGWLLLEESSAEQIIRGYLMPWFAPGLAGRLRTVSAAGADQVEPKFNDFNRLFLFLHLEPSYKKRAWVWVDGDDKGKDIVEKLQAKYTDWPPEHFAWFQQPAFERYYPANFADSVDSVLDLANGDARRQAKADLLRDVLAWIKEDEGAARAEFEQSAAEVIEMLKRIEDELA